MNRGSVSLLACVALAGCSGWQSALDPHSAEAGNLANLFWFFLAVCAAVWCLVAVALLFTLRRHAPQLALPGEDTPDRKRNKNLVVTALTVVTAMILILFTLMSFYATRGFTWQNKQTLTIKVTGRQWWWDIEYQNNDPHQVFETANEIHIPVGRPVTLDLEGGDVIHSFWVPNLMGKQDLIPGRTNYLTIQANRPGLYRGQCAEFCGLEHAHMAILVFAESEAAFDAWRSQQLKLAEMPGAPVRLAGMQIFLNRPCASCHAIAGTNAGGRLGPDLTHFASRATIAAGMLRNTPHELDAWLDDPQSLKPGATMPKVDLSPTERSQLAAYLEGLK